MAFLIGIAAVLQIFIGIMVYVGAKSAIHEILGAISFGMGILSLALAVIIAQLDDIKIASEKTASITHDARETQSKIAAAFDRVARG